MKLSINSRGSSHVVLLLVVIVVAFVGFVGYRVVTNNKKPVATNAAVAPAKTAPTTIKSKSDVQQANKSLENEKIDQNLDPNQLNGDLSSVF